MKRIGGKNEAHSGLTGLAAALCLVLVLYPAVSLWAEGGRPGALFDFGAGARPLAMGGSYSAVARDATAVYYNPAGLGLMPAKNLTLMHAALYDGATYDYFGYAQNFAKLPGAWGGQLMRLNVAGIEGRDSFNVRTSNVVYTETAFSAGAGLNGIFYPGLSVGLSAKVLNRSLSGESDNLLGFDAGLQYGPFYGDRLHLSFVAQNVGTFSTGDTSDRLPFKAKAGAAYLLAGSVMLAADVSSDGTLRLGTEYVMGPGALRAGYGAGEVSLGAGVKFLKAYSLDLAMTRSQDLGVSNRISVGYLFGGRAAAKPRAEVYAKDFLVQAEEDLKSGAWLNAYNSIAMAMGTNTALQKGIWGERHLRLGGLIKGLKLREMPDRENNFKGTAPSAAEAGRAAREYVEGQTVRSMLLAHSAAGYEPNNAFYQDLLKVLAGLNSREVVKDEILPRTMLVNAKLEKASAAFYVQDFKRAVKECSEVLMLEENNAGAWKKIGSAYYALGDTAKARNAYQKVLELNPQDTAVLKFMNLQGWK
jgi:hypothetical protein